MGMRRGSWMAGTAAVVVAVGVCVRLGVWQLDRLDERRAFNELVETRGQLPPVPLEELVPTGSPAEVEAAEYRRVTASGEWDGDSEFLIAGRSYRGSPGSHVVTPLRLDGGRAVLVVRGFVPVVDPEEPVPDAAKPPTGEVRVVAAVRKGATGGELREAEPEAKAAGTLGYPTKVNPELLGEVLGYALSPVSLQVEEERPKEQGLPIPLLPPEPGEGPHLGYAVQWFGFAVVFVVGWVVLLRRSARKPRAPAAA
ncbi:MAG: SURF1 family protein [Actinobacteria bacterium]|nr:SURF1 family protein [Actinomycetota bacterium]